MVSKGLYSGILIFFVTGVIENFSRVNINFLNTIVYFSKHQMMCHGIFYKKVVSHICRKTISLNDI